MQLDGVRAGVQLVQPGLRLLMRQLRGQQIVRAGLLAQLRQLAAGAFDIGLGHAQFVGIRPCLDAGQLFLRLAHRGVGVAYRSLTLVTSDHIYPAAGRIARHLHAPQAVLGRLQRVLGSFATQSRRVN
jgi:hypothetical protein